MASILRWVPIKPHRKLPLWLNLVSIVGSSTMSSALPTRLTSEALYSSPDLSEFISIISHIVGAYYFAEIRMKAPKARKSRAPSEFSRSTWYISHLDLDGLCWLYAVESNEADFTLRTLLAIAEVGLFRGSIKQEEAGLCAGSQKIGLLLKMQYAESSRNYTARARAEKKMIGLLLYIPCSFRIDGGT